MRILIIHVVLIAITITAGIGETWTHAQEANNYYDLAQRLDAIETQLAANRNLTALPSLPGDKDPPSTCLLCGLTSADCTCRGCQDKTDYPTVAINGFFHLDMGLYSQDANSRATLGDIEDSLGFRRARLSASGSVTDQTSYMMEYDFAQSQARFTDVWMQFAQTPLGNLRVGRYRQPFGMAEMTSIKELPFLERPLTLALAPFRQTGAMLSDTAFDESATWAVSGYRYLSDNFGNVYADTGGYGLATRLTMLPLDTGDEGLVHLGVDYSFNDPGRDIVQYVNTNEFFGGQNPNLGPTGLSVQPIVGVPPFVNTGQIATEHTNLFNVEGACSLGSLLVQSEARWAVLEQLDGTTQTFPGAYLHVRYVLTGETIPYNRKSGAFGRVQPLTPVNIACGDWGAWELAGRVSYLDLNGTGLPGPGRRLVDTTVGLNWYVNSFTKFQMNWIHANLDDPVLDESDTDTFAVRGQLNF